MTKILVVKRKHLFIAISVIVIVLILVILLIIKNRSVETDTEDVSAVYETASAYVPGVYTSEMPVGNYSTTLEVLVDEAQIKSIRLINSDEAVETMYPLVGSRIELINDSLRSGMSTEELMSESYSYTDALIMEQIELILERARISS